MPFGKYRDEPIHEIPKNYLNWLLNKCKLNSELKTAVILGLEGKEYLEIGDLESTLEKIIKSV